MSTPIKKVALLGASGNLGPYILDALKRHNFSVTIITRLSSSATFPPDSTVLRINDFSSEDELVAAFKGQDAVVNSISHAGNSKQERIIDAAIRAGVRHYIPSDFGSNAENKVALELQPRMARNLEATRYLRSKEAEGLTWTSIVTGFFIDMLIPNGYGGFKVPAREATIWDSGDVTSSVSTRDTIGEAVARTLLNPEKTANRYVYISTLETCQNDTWAALKRVTGDENWKIAHVSSKGKIKEGKEMLERGEFMMGSGTLALASAYGGGCEEDFRKAGLLANELLGLPDKEDLDVVLKKILEKVGQL